uniref:uncharacterized protein isoform X1 n=1 Tax=Myxine glutinosa TaxID=7769 RepID=UPI00358F1F58
MQVVAIIVLSLACTGAVIASHVVPLDIEKYTGQWYGISMVSDMPIVVETLKHMKACEHFVTRCPNEKHCAISRSAIMLKSGMCLDETTTFLVDGSTHKMYPKKVSDEQKKLFGSNMTIIYRKMVYNRYGFVESHIVKDNVHFKAMSIIARTPHVTEDIMEEFKEAVVQANLPIEGKVDLENKDFCNDTKVHYEKTNCGKDPFSIDKYVGYWITIAMAADNPLMVAEMERFQSGHQIVDRVSSFENTIIVKGNILMGNGTCAKSVFTTKINETSGKATPVKHTFATHTITNFTDYHYGCIDLEYENYGFLTFNGRIHKIRFNAIYLIARKKPVPESAFEKLAAISKKFGISKEGIVKLPSNEFCYEEDDLEKEQ